MIENCGPQASTISLSPDGRFAILGDRLAVLDTGRAVPYLPFDGRVPVVDAEWEPTGTVRLAISGAGTGGVDVQPTLVRLDPVTRRLERVDESAW